MTTMRTLRGRVVEGKVVVEGEALPEGAHVAVMVVESETDFVLTPALQRRLAESIAEADRGESSDFEAFIGEVEAAGG